MKIKSLFLPLLVALALFSCDKNTSIPSNVHTVKVNPFSELRFKSKDTPGLTIYPNQRPLEIGYSFSVSLNGAINEIGLCLPGKGHTYTTTLRNGTAKEVLPPKNITQYSGGFSFTNIDLVLTKETVSIQPDHTNMISVNQVPVGSANPGLAGSFYVASRTDLHPIFPLKKDVVTYDQQCNYPASTPTYPTNEIQSTNLIGGILDVMFTYTSTK